MDSRELREAYLSYFEREGHKRLPSASLIPDDPTLLFTSAGMVQFKDIFWGRVPSRYRRVTTCQKCFRTTDIERVGTTAYHHTFFEMLGNFSFGDYFKEGAIKLAWEFLTRELSLPKERLWVSVYENDDEAYAIWRDVAGIPPDRIVRLGKEHNWWGPVGGQGPCGPDTEIFWDWGEEHACGPECKGPACDCERFSEIWNLVFMQYDAQPDGTLRELARKNIDTGMGLERTTAVLEGVMSDFDTDLFRPICEEIESLSKARLPSGAIPIERNVIADHIRAVTFLISDGVIPDSKESRGSVLRKIFIRMLFAADFLGIAEGKLVRLVEPVIATLGDVYPEIIERRKLLETVIRTEEKTYRRRKETFARLIEKLHPMPEVIPGELIFKWYDTYGIPKDFIVGFASQWGLSIDWDGFEKAMAAQRARSRSVTTYSGGVTSEEAVAVRETRFVGYERLSTEGELVAVLDDDGGELAVAGPGEAKFVFSVTPFYAEAGGQIADTGLIENLSRPGKGEVTDVQKSPQGTLHFVRVLEGEFRPGDRCRLVVDEDRRRGIERAHTATHLLHAALRKILGEHVIQAGSWVGPDELRFDFTHFAALSEEELAKVEREAFRPVLSDIELRIQEMPLEEAKRYGAIAHFEEEYRGKDRVRVVEVPGVSVELCGGCHVRRTGEIGPIVILSEEAVAAGTRRIRALVGERAREYLAAIRDERRAIAKFLKVPEAELPQAVEKLAAELAGLRKELAAREERLAALQAKELATRAEEVAGVRLLGAVVEGGPEAAKRLADLLAERLGRCAVILGTRAGDRGVVVAKVTDDRLNAGALVREAAQALGGKGGGRPSFAQGGGPNASELPGAVSRALELARRDLRQGA